MNNVKDLIGKYVIVNINNGRIRFLSHNDINSGRVFWSANMKYAKSYNDLSAADIKVNNLKYDFNLENVGVRYVDNNLRLLAYVRRNRYGR